MFENALPHNFSWWVLLEVFYIFLSSVQMAPLNMAVKYHLLLPICWLPSEAFSDSDAYFNRYLDEMLRALISLPSLPVNFPRFRMTNDRTEEMLRALISLLARCHTRDRKSVV